MVLPATELRPWDGDLGEDPLAAGFARCGYAVLCGMFPPALMEALAGYFERLSAVRGPEGFDLEPDVPRSLKRHGGQDMVMGALSERVRPRLERVTGRPLRGTNPFARIYHRGSHLLRHTDRAHCEISCSVTVSYDAPEPWPLWLSNEAYCKRRKTRGGPAAVALEVGDLLVYLGTELEHWREPFAGEHQAQLLFHYVHALDP